MKIFKFFPHFLCSWSPIPAKGQLGALRFNFPIFSVAGFPFFSLLCLALLFLSAHAAFSQSIIKGTVSDTLGQPVTFANVLLLHPADSSLAKGMVTDEMGVFQFEEVNVQSSITASSGSVLDVLERSPGVKVDHNNSSLSMNSKNGVQVMINGKLNRMPMEALYQILGSMQAVSVDRVELITTPPANLDAEGNAGFINIVLLQSEGNGMNGSFFVNAEKRRRFNSAFGGISISEKTGSLFFSGTPLPTIEVHLMEI